MSRHEVINCDHMTPEGRCARSTAHGLAHGWLLGPPDYCPAHRPDRPNPSTRDPIPLRRAA